MSEFEFNPETTCSETNSYLNDLDFVEKQVRKNAESEGKGIGQADMLISVRNFLKRKVTTLIKVINERDDDIKQLQSKSDLCDEMFKVLEEVKRHDGSVFLGDEGNSNKDKDWRGIMRKIDKLIKRYKEDEVNK